MYVLYIHTPIDDVTTKIPDKVKVQLINDRKSAGTQRMMQLHTHIHTHSTQQHHAKI